MTIRQTSISDAEGASSAVQQWDPVVVRAGETRARTYQFSGSGVSGTCLLGAEQTGGVFSVFEIAAEPGAIVPPHIHTAEEATFYILEGSFEIQRGSQVIEMASGMAMHIPRGVVRSFCCVGDQTGRGLIITTPGGFEKFFEELNTLGGELSAPGEEGLTRIAAILTAYGIEAGPQPPDPTQYGHLAPSRFLGLGKYRGHVLASADETCGALILASLEVDPQGGPQPHLHRREDEAFYILEGCFRIMLGDQVLEAEPGDFVFAPRGAAHSWSNTGDVPAYALVIIAPAANFDAFTRRMEHLVAQIGEDPAPSETHLALRDEIRELYRHHRIELVETVEDIK